MRKVVRERVARVVLGLCIAVVVVPVGMIAWAASTTSWDVLPIDAVSAGSDETTIRAHTSFDPCGAWPEVRVVDQGPSAVVLEIRREADDGCDEGPGRLPVNRDFWVELDDVLADRTVVVRGLLPGATCDIDGRPSDRCVVGG